MPYQFKVGMIHQMNNIALIPGKIVIQANNFIPFLKESLTKMGTNEAGSSCN